MLAQIVKIGNSHGIRLPKPLLEQTGLKEQVDLRVEGNSIVLSPVKGHPREGWAEAARQMRENGDDEMLDPYTSNKFDEEEWEW